MRVPRTDFGCVDRLYLEGLPMKFYDCAIAPSPRRVRIFLAEKGITLPTIQVDLRKGEQFGDAFRAVNPDCTVPVLELDDGARIADILAICVYFEHVQPAPPLMGVDAHDRAIVTAWQRRVERDGFFAVAEAFRKFDPGIQDAGAAGAGRLRADPGTRRARARADAEVLHVHECASRRERVCRRRALYHRRYHHARGRRLRRLDQADVPGRLPAPAPLAPGGGGAAEREGVIKTRTRHSGSRAKRGCPESSIPGRGLLD